jgi:hypothetical protein
MSISWGRRAALMAAGLVDASEASPKPVVEVRWNLVFCVCLVSEGASAVLSRNYRVVNTPVLGVLPDASFDRQTPVSTTDRAWSREMTF